MATMDQQRWQSILRNYDLQRRPEELAELNYFERQPNLQSAIEAAAFAKKNGGQRFSHQNRLRHRVLKTSHAKLLKLESTLKIARTFDELFSLVESALNPIVGAGELYIYDTSLRVGAFLGLEPEKVYLHRGTRTGARHLGLPTRNRRYLEMAELPSELTSRKAHEVEDILCIYKAIFAGRLNKSFDSKCFGSRRKGC